MERKQKRRAMTFRFRFEVCERLARLAVKDGKSATRIVEELIMGRPAPREGAEPERPRSPAPAGAAKTRKRRVPYTASEKRAMAERTKKIDDAAIDSLDEQRAKLEAHMSGTQWTKEEQAKMRGQAREADPVKLRRTIPKPDWKK